MIFGHRSIESYSNLEFWLEQKCVKAMKIHTLGTARCSLERKLIAITLTLTAARLDVIYQLKYEFVSLKNPEFMNKDHIKIPIWVVKLFRGKCLTL